MKKEEVLDDYKVIPDLCDRRRSLKKRIQEGPFAMQNHNQIYEESWFNQQEISVPGSLVRRGRVDEVDVVVVYHTTQFVYLSIVYIV